MNVELPETPAWMDYAACTNIDDFDIFYPPEGGTGNPARAICATCPVANDCLNYALTNNERYGYWGGTSPLQRDAMRKAVA